MRFKRYKRIIVRTSITVLIVGLGVGLLAFAYGFVQSQLASANPGPNYFLNATDNVTGIQYGVAYSDGQLNGGVAYEFRTIEGVRKYQGFNLRTIDQLIRANQNQFYVLVIFNRPLSQGEFEQLTQTYQLIPYAYTLRAIAPNGMRTTIYGGPANGNLIPTDRINMVAKDIQERDGTTIRGWIDVSTVISGPQLIELLKDPRIYTIDATETLFRNSITPAKLINAGVSSDILQSATQGEMHIQISRVSLYWSLEDLGLVGTK